MGRKLGKRQEKGGKDCGKGASPSEKSLVGDVAALEAALNEECNATFASGPLRAWSTRDSNSSSTCLDGNSLAELRALQQELGLPLTDALPDSHGDDGFDGFAGASEVSSEVSGLTALLTAYHQEVQAAADKAADAVMAARTGLASWPPTQQRPVVTTEQGADLAIPQAPLTSGQADEDEEGAPQPRPALAAAAPYMRPATDRPTPSGPGHTDPSAPPLSLEQLRAQQASGQPIPSTAGDDLRHSPEPAVSEQLGDAVPSASPILRPNQPQASVATTPKDPRTSAFGQFPGLLPLRDFCLSVTAPILPLYVGEALREEERVL